MVNKLVSVFYKVGASALGQMANSNEEAQFEYHELVNILSARIFQEYFPLKTDA